MPTKVVGNLTFVFPATWHIEKYDDWSFYRNRFCRIQGAKAVDLLAISPDNTVFLIEVKDYRSHRRTKMISLADEVTQKVLATLAAMLPCRVNGDEAQETAFAARVLNANSLKIILHLEQPSKPSKLFPRRFDTANVTMEMRQRLKPIDAHPKVVELADFGGLAWTVQTT